LLSVEVAMIIPSTALLVSLLLVSPPPAKAPAAAAPVAAKTCDLVIRNHSSVTWSLQSMLLAYAGPWTYLITPIKGDANAPKDRTGGKADTLLDLPQGNEIHIRFQNDAASNGFNHRFRLINKTRVQRLSTFEAKSDPAQANGVPFRLERIAGASTITDGSEPWVDYSSFKLDQILDLYDPH
jgi:hypothetical protein